MDLVKTFDTLVHQTRQERQEAIAKLGLSPGEQLSLWQALEARDLDPKVQRERKDAREVALVETFLGAGEPPPKGLSEDELIDRALRS